MTEDLFAKLKRLRRELDAGRSDATERAPRAELPEWFKRRLAREEEPSSPAIVEPATPRRSPAAPRGLVERGNRFGAHAERVAELADDARHGAWRLGEARDARADELAWLASDDALARCVAQRLVFLDIETTGLAGGAGTHVFLVGLARFVDAGVELWQGFARGPEEEAALLATAAERIAAGDGLVTFFGKSFDRHRLQDKMRVHGVEPPFAGRAHLDLYHPLRRLYGGAFDDGRLATLERELCGVERERDLPGAFAPAAWFDFLAGRPHLLEEVFRHNFDDVQSLIVLCAHLACSRAGARGDGSRLAGPARARHAAFARLAARHGAWEAARDWLALAAADGALEPELVRLGERVARRIARAARASVAHDPRAGEPDPSCEVQGDRLR